MQASLQAAVVAPAEAKPDNLSTAGCNLMVPNLDSNTVLRADEFYDAG